jgi:hypothetical protein
LFITKKARKFLSYISAEENFYILSLNLKSRRTEQTDREEETKRENELILTEAGATFDNSFFDNNFDFLRQLKNGSFLGPVFVHVTGRSSINSDFDF